MSEIRSTRPVDSKTAIMDAKTERKYMNTFRGRACECCGTEDDTVVPAHLNLNAGGTGYRVKGAVAALCASCHDIADGRKGTPKWAHEMYGGTVDQRRREEIWMRVCQKLLLDRAREWNDEK